MSFVRIGLEFNHSSADPLASDAARLWLGCYIGCHSLDVKADTGRTTGTSFAMSNTTLVVLDGQHTASVAA